jgi:hypothetical protein
MRGALARLSLGGRSASSLSSAQAAAAAAAAGLPADTARALAASPLALGVFSVGGRALVAKRPLALGEVLLEEMPVAAAPSPERDPQAQCHHCLRLLATAASASAPQRPPPREPAIREEEEDEGDNDEAAPTARGDRSINSFGKVSFCSDACALAAEASYRRVERRVDFSPLREHCSAQRERFPLVAARLACAVLQAWESGGRERALARARGGGRGGGDQEATPQQLRRPSWLPRQLRSVSAPVASAAATTTTNAAGSEQAGREEEEDGAFVDAVAADAAASLLGPMPAVAYLCRANLPQAAAAAAAAAARGGNDPAAAEVLLPAAWQRSHALLVRALGTMLDAEPANSAARLLPCVRAVTAPGWYAGALSRLHLNSFRVEAAATPALLAAAAAQGETLSDAASAFSAALLQAAAANPASQALGSAVYSASSLANHSCDPNADAAWPLGNARLRLTARRDVQAGEQVTISYIDASLEVEERRALLKHSYGFDCSCARCEEEVAALPPDMPPLPR